MDMIGKKYGRLTILEEVERKGKYLKRFKCFCECGEITIAYQSSLRNGNKKSCGCIRKENTRNMFSSGTNEIIYYNDYAEIIMTDKSGCEKARSMIDLEDVDLIKKYRWWVSTKGYALAHIYGTNKNIHMHKLIHPGRNQVDHIDRNKLNNRKNNLRDATNQQNAMNQGLRTNNKSGVRGVCWNKNKSCWDAEIMKNGIKYHLGHFKEKEIAINTREQAEIKLFGDFSPIKYSL
jgi:hypothetical protein